MAWDTAVSDLRSFLNDNAKDRYCYRKKVFGKVDSQNLSFKTFEFRRITDFTDPMVSIAPLGVFVDGVQVLAEDDSIETGEFTLVAAPNAGSVVTATYYSQQLLDEELVQFLKNVSLSLLFGEDYTMIDPALREAALHLCAGDALRKLAMKWTQRSSDAFLLEDAPKKEALGVAETYVKLADNFSNRGAKLRDERYSTRAGQSLAPNFGTVWGRVSGVTPRR